MRHKSIMRVAMSGASSASILCVLLVMTACGMPLQEAPGSLEFPDFDDFTSIRGRVRGEIEFGEVLVGEKGVVPLTLSNQNDSSPLRIESISIGGEGFGFLDYQPPEQPLILEPGENRTLYIAFYPVTNGLHDGRIAVVSQHGNSYIQLDGTGMWEVTLSINDETMGEIISPVAVTEDGQGGRKTITTATGQVSLEAEASFLRKFSQWAVVGTPKIAPDFADELSTSTEVYVAAHTHIQAIFMNPWVFFPTDHGTLQAAIDAVASDGTKEGVIIENGVHSIPGSVSLQSTVSMYGGYNNGSSPNDRKYKTVQDREDPDYQAVLEFDPGAEFIIPQGKGMTLEGITFRRSGTSGTAVMRAGHEATGLVHYSTITAGGSGPALYADRSSPQIKNNLIRGGNSGDASTAVRIRGGSPYLEDNLIRGGTVSANYGQSFAVWMRDNAEPVLFRNTISGGSAPGTDAESFGLYMDRESRPLIIGNTITGGAAGGSGGISNGIYFLNNGRATIHYNSIDGGSGSTARALYSAYGTNMYLRYNTISNSGDGINYGIYLGANGRVRRLLGNGFANVSRAYQYRFLQGDSITSIDALNSTYNAGDDWANVDGSIDVEMPDEPGTQEWE